MGAWAVPFWVIAFVVGIPFFNAAYSVTRRKPLMIILADLVINFYSLLPVSLFLLIGNVIDFPSDPNDLWLLWCILTCWLMIFKLPLYQRVFKGLTESET